MRLIDADRLKEYVNSISSGLLCEWDTLGVLSAIDKQQTVDAAPIVHGKWLHDESGANYCSECMEFAYEDEEYHMIWHTKYCPHCGAKMDEGGKQDENNRG